MSRWTRTGRPGVTAPRRRLAALAAAALLVAGTAACDDDPAAPMVIDLVEVEGLYDVLTITFDPQGSAPAADVLNAFEEAGVIPTLNVGRTGGFQLVYRDPATGNLIPVNGTVDPQETGIDLVFESQGAADQFLFPRRLPLEYDAESGTLTFSGTVSVSRARLQQLFPELYADEQLFNPTPGTLTVGFRKAEG